MCSYIRVRFSSHQITVATANEKVNEKMAEISVQTIVVLCGDTGWLVHCGDHWMDRWLSRCTKTPSQPAWLRRDMQRDSEREIGRWMQKATRRVCVCVCGVIAVNGHVAAIYGPITFSMTDHPEETLPAKDKRPEATTLSLSMSEIWRQFPG